MCLNITLHATSFKLPSHVTAYYFNFQWILKTSMFSCWIGVKGSQATGFLYKKAQILTLLIFFNFFLQYQKGPDGDEGPKGDPVSFLLKLLSLVCIINLGFFYRSHCIPLMKFTRKHFWLEAILTLILGPTRTTWRQRPKRTNWWNGTNFWQLFLLLLKMHDGCL